MNGILRMNIGGQDTGLPHATYGKRFVGSHFTRGFFRSGVYGKGVNGLIQQIRNGTLGGRTLFWHTGVRSVCLADKMRLCSPLSRILVISNPKSKKNRNDPKLQQDLSEILGGIDASNRPRALVPSTNWQKPFLPNTPDVVAINGGDGTVGVVMTALNKAWDTSDFPQILLLRGGTMNTVAKNWA